MSVLISRQGRVVTARIDRPDALNALNAAILHDMVDGLRDLDRDPEVGCFIVTGSARAFAAGADVKEMRDMSYVDMQTADAFSGWEKFAALRTPKIAAVSGYALGGGCELALMCDIIFAAESAKFGQPEIKLGIIPGMGGSQRLARLVGRSKAMDMILTGRTMDAAEAERCGLAARVVPDDRLLEEAMQAAQLIAGYGKIAVTAAREAVARADEVSLREGLLFERRAFHALFATEDQKEGMSAFIEKRPPDFKGR